MKHVSWILALVVGVAVGFFAKSALVGAPTPSRPAPQAQRAARPQEDPRAIYRVPLEDSPARGPADALVTVVEVSDFECPFCRRVAPTIKQLAQAYEGKLRFVFKQNPLPMHPNAVPAALLAEEGRAEKGDAGFWAVHDALFEPTQTLDPEGLKRVAAGAGLDPTRVAAALAGQTALARIQRDQQLVNGLGAGSTPTFFINGRKLVGGQPFEAFKTVIDEELQKAEGLVRGGVAPGQLYETLMAKAAVAPVMVAGAAGAQPAAAAPPAPPPPPRTSYAKVAIRADDPARGPADALLTVVLFSDFQCPFCSRVAPTLKQLEAAFPGKVRLVWKHQPLPNHQNARPAALLAEGAREQGKFWPLHDALFASQADLSGPALERAARGVGVDLARARSAQTAARAEARIAQDQAEAQQINATATPTMFFNCRQVVGAIPFEQMRPIAEEELKKAEAVAAHGARRGAGFYEKACDANLAAVPAAPTVTLRPDDPAKGPASAPITVVVFSDFQCPFCARVRPTLEQVTSAYGDRVRVVWKHKPLSFHPNAMPAAEAAEAAREQGKFWPMHDKLFAGQRELSPESYERWARELGLDLPRFRASLASGKGRARIQEDDALSAALGINGTPSILVNGEPVPGGAVPFEVLKAVIDRKLTAAR